jgi:hypothetical protein
LLDGLGSIFFSELSLVADTIEQFTASCQLSNDIVFVLSRSVPGQGKRSRTNS